MIIMAIALIALGAVSIWLGFGYKYPDASGCGAVFFVGGCLLLGFERMAWYLTEILKSLPDKPKSE